MFTQHPYGKPIIGWMHEIEGLNREDALAYYRRFYTPANAILVVAGDVTAEAVREVAAKWLDKRLAVTGYLLKDEAEAA